MTNAAVIVGASERTPWSYWFLRNLVQYNYEGPIWMVSSTHDSVFGYKCVTSIAAIPDPLEVGLIALRADLCLAAVRELVECGVRTVVVVSTGFRETNTPEGRAAEAEIADVCSAAGVRLIGPNCVGYADFTSHVCAVGVPFPGNVETGNISIVSQSGGLHNAVIGSLQNERLGIDQSYSIGNGAGFGVAEAFLALAENESTRIVCGVIEGIQNRELFEKAIQLGRSKGKEFVIVLLGSSRRGRRAALSHTGSIVGEGAMMRVWFESLGIYVTSTVSETAVVAALLTRFGRPDPDQGVFIATGSGGCCSLTADLAEHFGVRMAEPTMETYSELRDRLSSGAFVGNPLDLLGAKPGSNGKTLHDIVMADPHVGLVLAPQTLTWPNDEPRRSWNRSSFAAMIGSAERANVPLVAASVFQQSETDWISQQRESAMFLVTDDISATLGALGTLYPQSGQPIDRADGDLLEEVTVTSAVLGEAPARKVFAALDFPLVRGVTLEKGDPVEMVLAELIPPWVVKVASKSIVHKGRIGGVKLGVCDVEQLRHACDEITHAVRSAGFADEAEEFLIQEMVFGPELLVTFMSDAGGARMLTVGIGGWAVETQQPFGTLLLPADSEKILASLHRWGLTKLLGDEAVEDLAQLLIRAGANFCSGELMRYSTIELNPVIVTPEGCLIADVLILE